MSSDERRVPELRFKGFTEDWEQRKLGQVAQIIGGGTPSTSISEYWDGEINWYSPAELESEIYVKESKRKITTLGLQNCSAKLLPQGTVLFTSRAGIGKTAILASVATTNQGFQSIVPRENLLDSYFIYSRSNVLKRYGEVFGAGSTFVEVSGKQMSKMPIFLPTLNEQVKLGIYIKELDNIIALHQRKKSYLKSLKQVYMNKLFTNSVSKNPELRSKGFIHKWEQRKLGEVSKIKTGSSDLKDADISGIYPFFVRSEKVERSNRYIYDGEAILIPGEGKLGEIYHYINGKFDYHQRVYKVSDYNEMVEGKFVYYYLSKYFKRHALKYTVKATVDSLRLPTLLNFNICIPVIDEQIQITEIIKNIDFLINQNQLKVDKLAIVKKIFLKKLFI